MKFLPLLALATSATALKLSALVEAFDQPDCPHFHHNSANHTATVKHKIYNVDVDTCHNTKKIDVVSYKGGLSLNWGRRGRKSCVVEFYEDSKCKEFLMESDYVEKERMSNCENVPQGMEIGSLRLHCWD